jgi:hypothetical protein
VTNEAATIATTYVLPMRWVDDLGLQELADYVNRVSRLVAEVIVVDGSPPERVDAHRDAFADVVRVLTPQPYSGGNGKVAGVLTGIREASEELVTIADDDVRYGADELAVLMRRLSTADLVRPQNVFSGWSWHARWDTGRSLINRAFGGDYPGTFGVRRSTLLAAGGYANDVLFENLELIRTIRAAGGREVVADDVFVPRLPPSANHFWSQRVRQAYDDFAQPGRLAVELALLPLIAGGVRYPAFGVALASAVVAVAEVGRRRRGGKAHYSRFAALWALPWVAERSLCVWLAVGARAHGGVMYAGSRLFEAAHSEATIRRRLAARASEKRPDAPESRPLYTQRQTDRST